MADHIIVGGGIANTFLQAAGLNIGKSLFEESMIDVAKTLLDKGKIILPKNVVTSKSFEGEDIKEKLVNEVAEEEMILDLNIEEETKRLIRNANTILWNGPIGVFENDAFAQGTKCLSEAISKSEAFSFCLLYTSPSPRDQRGSRMPSSA